MSKIKVPKKIYQHKLNQEKALEMWNRNYDDYKSKSAEYALEKSNLRIGELVKFPKRGDRKYFGVIVEPYVTYDYNGYDDDEVRLQLWIRQCNKSGVNLKGNADLIESDRVIKLEGKIIELPGSKEK